MLLTRIVHVNFTRDFTAFFLKLSQLLIALILLNEFRQENVPLSISHKFTTLITHPAKVHVDESNVTRWLGKRCSALSAEIF